MPGKKKAAAAEASQGGGAGSVGTSPRGGMAAAARTHKPGQDDFRSILPEDTDWQPFAPFPPSARLAVVVGEPPEPGTLPGQGQGAPWCEVDAAQAP